MTPDIPKNKSPQIENRTKMCWLVPDPFLQLLCIIKHVLFCKLLPGFPLCTLPIIG